MDKPTPPKAKKLATDSGDGHITEGFTESQMLAHGEAMAAWGAAQERKALLDCRTCRQHTTVSGGCMSVLQCVEGSAIERTAAESPAEQAELARANSAQHLGAGHQINASDAIGPRRRG